MLHVLGCIYQQHDLRIVLLAGLLCAFASWTAVTLLGRAAVVAGAAQRSRILVAGFVFGAGVWATHFVAMLAYRSGLPIGYAVIPTVLSIAVAVIVSAVGFALILRPNWGWIGGALVGLAISAMHFIGMAALQGPFDIVWNGWYLSASILVGVVMASLAALMGTAIRGRPGRITAAILLALAICGMHFTAMSAMTISADPAVAYGDVVIAPNFLAVAIAAVAILIVALGLAGAWLDDYLDMRSVNEAERLRAHIVELEKTQIELERTSGHLRDALVQADAANQSKSQFLASMSHELRTPLNAVIGFAEVLASEMFGPLGNGRYREYAGDIASSGKHLLELINDILDLSRLDAGQMVLKDEIIDVAEFVRSTCRMLEQQAQAVGIALTFSVSPQLPALRADGRRLRQILINLLSNALKFTPAGGVVDLTASLTGEGAVFCVSDSGIGIAAVDIPKVLERFGQVENALSRKYEGAGLGLPLSKQLIELLGGRLVLDSVPNIGTTVKAILPRERIMAVPPEVAKAVA